jgi:diketogulonate reductase-like aldo/keto reductase
LLTANAEALTHAEARRVAQRHGRSVSQIVFRFALDVGMIPLTGTTSDKHMRDDLDVFGFQLEPAEIARIENVAVAE